LAVAAVVYVVPTFILPHVGTGNPIWGVFTGGAKRAAPYLALMFAALAPFAYLNSLYRRRLLDSQTGLDCIRAMPWQQFEHLVGEGFRRLGYAVEEKGGAAPDGGIDLVLRKDGATTVVQCKHWKARQVGVAPIRELYGVMVSEKANDAFFVTSGVYTKEAEAFAEGKPIALIDGRGLLELIETVHASPEKLTKTSAAAPSCPVCSRSMVLWIIKKGQRAGEKFWGCTAYPTCKGTRTA